MVDHAGQEKSKKKKTTMRSSWFSRATKFHLKKNSEIKPVPIYETEKQNSTVELEDDKQNLFRVIRQVTDRKHFVAAIGHDHETKEKNTNEQRDINPDALCFLGYETYHEQASTTVRGGKLDPAKTIGSGSGSKPKELREKSSFRVRKVAQVDPVIGITIIMVTLMIMLMWGRLCAILCTSTWCYFLPRLREVAIAAKRKRRGGGKGQGESFPGGGDLDLNSQAYKKKVVLEGFLLRQRRNSL
ncbi:unnamed protein product [Microthlaspi erraticum]|uniref:Uncharacterized protein n=1 Tax=Microthlaspi erraticum TaxID=1685480 RepID=A0A6D2I556_9BRAS|nr:unnamed protein product [Microthlaspi erraticum]